MIIDGHPDILRGPMGLNGLHGFGSTPNQSYSEAYTRFLPENGGLGIDALYQEIRDFVSTHSDAEILQAMNASGVTVEDYVLALDQKSIPPSSAIAPSYVPNPAETQPTPSQSVFEQFCPPGSILVGGSCVSVGGSEQYDKTIAAADAAKAALANYVANEVAQGRTPTKRQMESMESYFYQNFYAMAFSTQDKKLPVVEPSPATPPKPSSQEIRDFVSTNSDAEILAAMARSGVTQSDIIRAFREVDAALATGQSPAFTRYLPENGGLGLEALYKEINDYASTHSFYELLAQMQRSGVSMKDVDAANSYAFGKQQSQTPAEYAAAQAAQAAAQAAQAAAEQAARRAAERRRVQLEAEAAQHSAEDRAEQALMAQFAAERAAEERAKKYTGGVDDFIPRSKAYYRFLPESGGKGIDALYQEIRDFINTPGRTQAEIKQAMFASGVSDKDVENAFANAPMQPVTPTSSTKGSGLTLPLVVSAIAAYFLVG